MWVWKTEVAIRAAFKAVADSKQVAVLVPTTVLALQHYKTFKKRLQHLPCTVDYISRFKSNKEKNNITKISRRKNRHSDWNSQNSRKRREVFRFRTTYYR